MTWGCSVWSQVSGSAVGTSGRFPEGAHKVQAAFPEDHSGGPDGAGCGGLWKPPCNCMFLFTVLFYSSRSLKLCYRVHKYLG